MREMSWEDVLVEVQGLDVALFSMLQSAVRMFCHWGKIPPGEVWKNRAGSMVELRWPDGTLYRLARGCQS